MHVVRLLQHQSDALDLGLLFLDLVGRITAECPTQAQAIFRAPSTNACRLLHRCIMLQLKRLVGAAGLPCVVAADALREALQSQRPRRRGRGVDPVTARWGSDLAAFQVPYLTFARTLVRESPPLAGGVLGLSDAGVVRDLADLTVKEIIDISSTPLVALNSSIGYQMLMSLCDAGAAEDRLELAGIASIAWVQGQGGAIAAGAHL